MSEAEKNSYMFNRDLHSLDYSEARLFWKSLKEGKNPFLKLSLSDIYHDRAASFFPCTLKAPILRNIAVSVYKGSDNSSAINHAFKVETYFGKDQPIFAAEENMKNFSLEIDNFSGANIPVVADNSDDLLQNAKEYFSLEENSEIGLSPLSQIEFNFQAYNDDDHFTLFGNSPREIIIAMEIEGINASKAELAPYVEKCR